MPKTKHSVSDQPNERLFSAHDIHKYFQLSRSTVWRYVNGGMFPRPIRIGIRRIAWRESDVLRWIEERSGQNRAA